VSAMRDRLETHGESRVSPGASPLSGATVFLPHRDTVVSCMTHDTLTTSSSSADCYDD